jgi:hypothetical protein
MLDSLTSRETHFLLEPQAEPDVDDPVTDMARGSLPSSDASFWMPDVSCTHLHEQFSTFGSEEKETESDISPCHSVLSLLDLSSSTSTSTLSTSSSTSSTLSSACETTDLRPRVLPLSPQERKAHYAWLDRIIGPPSGIQESMGTYKAFMEHQREVYYDRLLLMTEQPSKVAVPHRATNEFISWLRGMATPGIPAHDSLSSIVTAPQVDFMFTRPATNPSASGCRSSMGSSLPQDGRTDTDTYRHSRAQGVVAALSAPQLSPRLPCPIPERTRLGHSRRRTFSATVDM